MPRALAASWQRAANHVTSVFFVLRFAVQEVGWPGSQLLRGVLPDLPDTGALAHFRPYLASYAVAALPVSDLGATVR